MIERKLLHFNSKDAFDLLRTTEGIADTSIAFVKDDEEGNFIFTHGEYYMGGTGSSQSSEPVTPAEGKYYDLAFKVAPKEYTAIEVGLPDNTWPQNADAGTRSDGWAHFVSNDTQGNAVWMAVRLTTTDGTALENWKGPWRISGSDGQAGADGMDIEFIYCQNNTPTTAPTGYNSYTGSWPSSSNSQQTISGTLTAEQYKTQDDFVPQNWYDNAQGISESMQCEWISIRTKEGGEWGPFGAPVLWSHWGKNGTDGDGVEYIYAPKQENQSIVSYPNSWTTDANFDTAEYIRSNATGEWYDNPQDLSSVSYGPGSKQYVSVRKQQNGHWQAYSAPVIWNVYPKDGVASGYTVDLSNPNMPVILDANGETASSYTNSTVVFVAHNGLSQIATDQVVPSTGYYKVSLGSITRSDSGSTSGIGATVSAVDNKTVTININAGINLNNVSIYVPISVTLDNGDVRNQTVTLYGVRGGADGLDADFIDLYTDAKVIRQNYQKTIVSPTTLEVGLNLNKTQILAGSIDMPAGYTFDYYYDALTSSTVPVTVSSSPISLSANHETITVRMYYNNTIIDSDTIPYITDGAPGIRGAEAVNYSINVLSSTIKVVGSTVSGEASFQVIKKQGDAVDMLTGYNFNYPGSCTWKKEDNSTYTGDEIFTASIAGASVNPATSSTAGVWTLTVPGNTVYNANTSTAVISLSTDTQRTLCSTIIPFSIKGEQGSSGSQSLDGVIIRFNNQYAINTKYYTGQTAVNGIKYLDVVLASDGNYYMPIQNANGYVENVNPTTIGQTSWEMFQPQSNAYINTLIADKIAATDITAKQVVITSGTGSSTTTVAGMVSGSYIPAGYTTNNNGIRIFAGTVPLNGDISGTAFNVDESGNLVAGAGTIKLNSDGSGYVSSNNLAWDASGNITKIGFSPIVGGSNYDTFNCLRNGIIVDKISIDLDPISDANSKISDSLDIKIYVKGFVIKNGLFVRFFNVSCSTTYGQFYPTTNGARGYAHVGSSLIDGIFRWMRVNDTVQAGTSTYSHTTGAVTKCDQDFLFYFNDIFDADDFVTITTAYDVYINVLRYVSTSSSTFGTTESELVWMKKQLAIMIGTVGKWSELKATSAPASSATSPYAIVDENPTGDLMDRFELAQLQAPLGQ